MEEEYSVQEYKVNKKGRHISGWENFFRVLFIPVMKFFYPYKIHGNKKVSDGPVIFVCNHYGIFDIFYSASLTWEGIHYMAKSDLSEVFLVKNIMKCCRSIFVKRDGTDVRGIMDSLKVLKKGDKICLFPEGTRNKTEQEILPFYNGASLFALKAKVPVVPITIYKKPKLFRRTDIIVGKPVELTEFYDQRVNSEVLEKANERLKELILSQRYEFKKSLEEKKRKKIKKSK